LGRVLREEVTANTEQGTPNAEGRNGKSSPYVGWTIGPPSICTLPCSAEEEDAGMFRRIQQTGPPLYEHTMTLPFFIR
jgi:hypothetical protein